MLFFYNKVGVLDSVSLFAADFLAPLRDGTEIGEWVWVGLVPLRVLRDRDIILRSLPEVFESGVHRGVINRLVTIPRFSLKVLRLEQALPHKAILFGHRKRAIRNLADSDECLGRLGYLVYERLILKDYVIREVILGEGKSVRLILHLIVLLDRHLAKQIQLRDVDVIIRIDLKL